MSYIGFIPILDSFSVLQLVHARMAVNELFSCPSTELLFCGIRCCAHCYRPSSILPSNDSRICFSVIVAKATDTNSRSFVLRGSHCSHTGASRYSSKSSSAATLRDRKRISPNGFGDAELLDLSSKPQGVERQSQCTRRLNGNCSRQTCVGHGMHGTGQGDCLRRCVPDDFGGLES